MRGAKALVQTAPGPLRVRRNRSSRLAASVANANASAEPTFPLPIARYPTGASGGGSANIPRRDIEERVREADVLVTPSPTTQPPLLLEGDNYYFSQDGVSKTLYRLDGQSSTMVEENFHVDSSRKRYFIRKESNVSTHQDDSEKTAARSVLVPNAFDVLDGIVSLPDPVHEIDLQEIASGVNAGAGTGAVTWESTIAMYMYFSSNPSLLQGDVIELGSGLGLGGILCGLGTQEKDGYEINSLTLTDYNSQVLEQCSKNVESAQNDTVPIGVSRLDWYDAVSGGKSFREYSNKFNTVIACDCAYLRDDIIALATTIKGLLQDCNSRAHVFGPHNRVGLHELVKCLREQSMTVVVEEIDMQRYRLKPSSPHPTDNGVTMATRYEAKFLHVTCCLPQGTSQAETSLFEID